MIALPGAACAHADPELFYPVEGGGQFLAHEAKAVCATCPATTRSLCLEYALSLSVSEDQGVWGGTTESERIETRKQRTRGLAA